MVKRGGKQFRKSFKTKDRKLAERSLVAFREKVSRLNPNAEKPRITFEELAARWFETVKYQLKPSSARRRETSIAQLNKHFGKLTVRDISHRICDEWVIRRGDKVAASTFNNERETLRTILEHAKRDGLILDNPAIAIKRRKSMKKAIVMPNKEQFAQMVTAIRNLDCRASEAADLVELLGYSGMRLAEATAFRWSELNFKQNCFTVSGGEVGTKNLESRTVPLFPALRELLERLEEERQPEPEDRVIRIDTAKRAMESACRKSGLPRFTHHSLRHYFVSNAIEVGVDFKTIAGWVGHKDGGVLVAQTYGHLRDAHSFEMAKLMTFSTKTTAEAPGNVVKMPAVG